MRSSLLSALALLVLCAPPAAAQVPDVAAMGAAVMSRADLERLLELYEVTALSPAYSDGVRQAARLNAARVRQRLEEGDFRVGDRVQLTVEGEEMPDEITVEVGPRITLPIFGSISLAGVLRSEIQDHLTRELGRTIKDPVVQARGLMRLSIRGSVLSPGFFVLPTDMLVTDALMAAGGPAADADLAKLRVERGAEVIAEGPEMQDAIIQGRTLDQLSLRAGDQIVVPPQRQSLFAQIGRIAALVAGAVFLGVRTF